MTTRTGSYNFRIPEPPKDWDGFSFVGEQLVRLIDSTHALVEGTIVVTTNNCYKYFIYLWQVDGEWVRCSYDDRMDLGDYNNLIVHYMDDGRIEDEENKLDHDKKSLILSLLPFVLSRAINKTVNLKNYQLNADWDFWNYAIMRKTESMVELTARHRQDLQEKSKEIDFCKQQLAKLELKTK